MDSIFILGAGASAPFGVPTLRHMFNDRQAELYLEDNPGFLETLNSVFWGPRGLTPETSSRGLTIEEILTIVRDYDKHTFEAPDLPIGDVDVFRRHLYSLSKRSVYNEKSSNSQYLNPLLSYSSERFDNVVWASFNWDCLFEASYYYSGGPTNRQRWNPTLHLDLEGWHNPYGQDLFLKLHGGVNWWFENEQLVYLQWGRDGSLDRHWEEYEEGRAVGHPVLLEPSFYKYSDPVYNRLKPQWDRFVNELLEADVVIIIGYSLPEADPEARRALNIAFQGNSDSIIIVINPSDWACRRYERLFGTVRLQCIEESYHEIDDIGGEIDRNIEMIKERAG